MHVPHTQTLASVLTLNLFKPKLCPPGQQTVVRSCNQILSSTKEVPAPTARGSVTQRGAGEGDGKERACACARASWEFSGLLRGGIAVTRASEGGSSVGISCTDHGGRAT